MGSRDPWRNHEKKTLQAEDYQVQKKRLEPETPYTSPVNLFLLKYKMSKGKSPEKESSQSGKKHICMYISNITDCLYLYIYIHVNMSLRVILLYLDSKLIKFRSPGRWPSGVSTNLGIVERSHPSTRHWPQSVHYLSANWFKKNDPLENMAGWNIPISHRK